MNHVVCVLKSGVYKPWDEKDYTIEYSPRHVRWLRDQFADQVKAPHTFTCMSDIDVPGVNVLPLKHNLPGWWSKLEIFENFTQAAYFDLDTVLIGDVSPYIFRDHKFSMAGSLTRRYGYNSSVMCWKGNYDFLLHKFLEQKDKYIAEYRKPHMWGDQDFIRDMMRFKHPIQRLHERSPGLVLSYKHDVRDKGKPKNGLRRIREPLRGDWKAKPRVVCFHGKPKPFDVDETWVPKLCAN